MAEVHNVDIEDLAEEQLEEDLAYAGVSHVVACQVAEDCTWGDLAYMRIRWLVAGEDAAAGLDWSFAFSG